jgi:hypothetical protein
MSHGKFAAITSSLLARKGEATPCGERTPLPWRTAPPLAQAPEPAPKPASVSARPVSLPEAVKRCTVRLSPQDYERLGIMAVKKDVTRQQFLRSALARVLDEIAREFPTGCACIGGCGQSCAESCAERCRA